MSAISMDANKRPCRHAILRNEETNKFLLFDSYDEIRGDGRYKKEVKHFHEILIPDTHRRIFFDIDRDEPFTIEEIVTMENVLRNAVAEIYNIILDKDEFAVYLSQYPENEVTEQMGCDTKQYIHLLKDNNEQPKGSVHLVSKRITLHDHFEHKALYDAVARYLKPMRKVYP